MVIKVAVIYHPHRGFIQDRLQSEFDSRILAKSQVSYNSHRIFSVSNVSGFLAQ